MDLTSTWPTDVAMSGFVSINTLGSVIILAVSLITFSFEFSSEEDTDDSRSIAAAEFESSKMI